MPALSKINLSKETTVKCPHCKNPVIWNSKNSSKPFCSERCKLIDLGEWAAGERVIPGEFINESESEIDFDGFLQ
jgi:hypothetical protein